MKNWLIFLTVGLLFIFGAAGLLLAQESPMHPIYPLLDAAGEPVLTSGQPVSTLKTCGSCHDTAYITQHTLHGNGGQTAPGSLPPAAEPTADTEMNCFLCHSPQPNNAARLEALSNQQTEWASTATLLNTGIVTFNDTSYQYNAAAFDSQGNLLPDYVAIQDPRSDNCGACHGQVHLDNQTPIDLSVCDSSDWRTYTTGQVASPQRIVNGGANIAGRAELTRTWDVHTERTLNCVDCHFSVNNPVYSLTNVSSQPEHLTFDPRRIDLGEYLQRPSHEFASGSDSMRTCESCHDAAASHQWLPYLDRHTSALACESCHVPQLYAPALAYRDATVIRQDGTTLDACRGIDGGLSFPPDTPVSTLITGYQPVLLQQTDADGSQKLSPYNLVSVWYWVHGDPEQQVTEADLRAAYLDGDTYAPEVIALFDANADQTISEAELILDTEAKTTLIAQRLSALGLENPRITAQLEPYPIHHNIIGGEWATRDCQTCHSDQSRLVSALTFADYLPGGVLPTLPQDKGVAWNGLLEVDDAGSLRFTTGTQTPAASLYIFGYDSSQVMDTLGILVLLATSIGVIAHASLRIIAGRRRATAAPVPIERAYMYSVYERQWHWLQTALIFGLTFSGLVIHRPNLFSAFNFAWMVDVHNIFAVLLIANAALALFYHLASGEIKQFIPRPYGFFDNMIEQALFYLRGIFRGDPHPFEKTPREKLNPLQQVTYLMLLNLLLPAQIITGALMWGAQHVPQLTNMLGGLPVLAPVHTLIAWLFVSFIVLHVYLTTTGHTPLAGIRAMVTGYDELEGHTPDQHAENVSSS